MLLQWQPPLHGCGSACGCGVLRVCMRVYPASKAHCALIYEVIVCVHARNMAQNKNKQHTCTSSTTARSGLLCAQGRHPGSDGLCGVNGCACELCECDIDLHFLYTGFLRRVSQKMWIYVWWICFINECLCLSSACSFDLHPTLTHTAI